MRPAAQERFRRSFAMTCSAAALLAGVAFIQPAMAQADAGTDAAVEEGDEEVVVTARRREERLQDVPVAITALPAQQLERYAVTSFSDISTFVPSMVVGRQVSGSAASIFLRGIGSSSLSAGFDQSVSFNLDGMPMTRGRELLFSQYDLDRVEVLKGPQALFFGKNTTGGLVSVITKNPTDEVEVWAKAGYGFEADEAYGEAVISGPITDTLLGRIAIRASRSEGAFVNSAEPSRDPATGFARGPVSDRRGGSKNISGRATLVFEPSESVSFNLKAGYTHYEDNGGTDVYERVCGAGRTVPFPTQGYPDPYADCIIDGRADKASVPIEVARTFALGRDGHPYTDLETYFGILNASVDFDRFTLSSITSFYHFDQSDFNDYNGATRVNAAAQFSELDQFSQEVRLESNFDGPVNFMIGAFYADTTFTFDVRNYFLVLPFDPVTQSYLTFARDDGFDGTSLSAFAEIQWEITPELELSGGARWSREEKDSYVLSLPANSGGYASFPPNVLLTDRFKDDNVSPQVTLTYKFTPDISVYASYKEGFKAGGFNLSQTISPGVTADSMRFGSEYGSGWELGFRSMLDERRLRFNVTVYDYLYEDLQVQFYNSVTTGQVVANAGGLKVRGVELDLNWRVPDIDNLVLRATAAYNDASYETFVGNCYTGQTIAQGCNLLRNVTNTAFTSQDYTGRQAPKAPKWGVQLGASYEFAVTNSIAALLTFDVTYSSAYNYTDTLRPDAVQDAFTKIDGSFALIDDERGWKVSLIGRNLTNELVVTTGNDISFGPQGGTGTAVGTVADMNVIIDRPREIFLELTVDF